MTETFKLRISGRALAVKAIVQAVLASFAVWTIVVIAKESNGGLLESDSETLSAFKVGAVFLSCILLLPFFVEACAHVYLLGAAGEHRRLWLDSDTSKDHRNTSKEPSALPSLVFFKKRKNGALSIDWGPYEREAADQGASLPFNIFTNLLIVLLAPIYVNLFGIIVFFFNCCGCVDEDVQRGYTFATYCLFIRTFVLLPDMLLSVLLFPLSALVILSSQTAGEVLINIVAVQIFAQLDDILVKMVTRQDVSIAQTMLLYVDDEEVSQVSAPASSAV